MRFYAAQEGHVVNALPPVDVDGGWTSDYWKMTKHSHVSILVSIGVSAAAISNIKVKSADDAAGTNAANMAFNYFAEETAGGDTLGAMATAVAGTGIEPSANDNIMYVIEIDAAELPQAQPWMAVEITNGSGNSVMASVMAVLSGSRYAEDQNDTAIA